ncbi:LOW QUALITY PROTEIN: G-type lectin S-receptor-like serine/threonine-protein kinase SD2-5 [Salvia hispanica]|uniref:LOW QUALITY PROTEIN: G-type lectin S-receptor-like serine/threonine-protein kinase SD2-5 n=1 Tax=Salvia hispanica TaxID=49212 RepID=UPI002009BBB7|nr:LOW QUALITY PROTEIN: G-type lectin S-receptor-like serine/threonine-protein kinase SD2-5 [Salvia hispanica]
MGNWGFSLIPIVLLLLLEFCNGSVQRIGRIDPGFRGAQMHYIDNDGMFMLSNNSNFAFGLTTTAADVTQFLLVVMHKSSTIVWAANRDSPVKNSDSFEFDVSGNAFLQSDGSTIWSSDTANKGVSSLQLLDNGNLVLVGSDNTSFVWQSFSHPTNTLLPNQEFSQGMRLVSDRGTANLTYSLEIKDGDMSLRAGFNPPQLYWTMRRDTRITINKGGGAAASAILSGNSWKFYDSSKVLLWQFIFSESTNANATWIAVIGSDGSITFSMLQGSSTNPSSTRIPQDQCSRPTACDPYAVCYPGNSCQCPSSITSCKSMVAPPCDGQVELVSGGDDLSYFALPFVQPFSKETTLDSCKASCLSNCSCGAMFFQNSSGNCFLFNYSPDGTRLAVKQLEGIGQGKKEFRAEVSIIGSIHHVHLVRLRGFCADGSHRLLAYEYMANGSLDKWLFKQDKGEFLLDWNTRYNIAVGTAKGLAYLHEDCDVKIIHCDIKPENVLLDDHFMAKVSDFGLAKLMTREQSHVFTTMRGTRGYLAPEWITSYAISEKSDVYSYGMVLLELIGGRKNYDPSQSSEKSHFPSYAFKMMEEGKLKEIMDEKLKINEEDERIDIAIKVALWCIQDDMHLRPPMTKVVQMLEGLSPVPPPPTASQLGSRLYSSFFKSISEGGTSSGPSDCNSDAYLSAVRLSGPR